MWSSTIVTQISTLDLHPPLGWSKFALRDWSGKFSRYWIRITEWATFQNVAKYAKRKRSIGAKKVFTLTKVKQHFIDFRWKFEYVSGVGQDLSDHKTLRIDMWLTPRKPLGLENVSNKKHEFGKIAITGTKTRLTVKSKIRENW